MLLEDKPKEDDSASKDEYNKVFNHYVRLNCYIG